MLMVDRLLAQARVCHQSAVCFSSFITAAGALATKWFQAGVVAGMFRPCIGWLFFRGTSIRFKCCFLRRDGVARSGTTPAAG